MSPTANLSEYVLKVCECVCLRVCACVCTCAHTFACIDVQYYITFRVETIGSNSIRVQPFICRIYYRSTWAVYSIAS